MKDQPRAGGERPCFLCDSDFEDLPTLVLASASPRRKELLRAMGVRFRVEPSHVNEPERPHLSPRETVMHHALAKARDVARRFPGAVVIGADTIVVLGRRVFGKPRNAVEAARMLRALQGKTHRVITAVCLVQLRRRKQLLFTDTTAVTFRPLEARQIQSYLRRVHALDKAGAYAIQEHGDKIVAKIQGSYSNVVGFPVEKFEVALRRFLRT